MRTLGSQASILNDLKVESSDGKVYEKLSIASLKMKLKIGYS